MGMAREKRASDAFGCGVRKLARSGSSDPTQNATQIPCRKTAGRLTARGAALLACPLSASARPTPMRPTSESVRARPGDRAAKLNSAANSAKAATIAVRP